MPENPLQNQNEMLVGRYAPSPTGALHLGNLRTALLAWLQIRLQGGRFLLRMEDLDTPRVVQGSADQILKDLEWLGLDWDDEVVYQSHRLDLYQDALQELQKKDLVYPCYCSRKDIQQAASAPHINGNIYPGFCRNLTEQQRSEKQQKKSPALRVKVEGDLQRSCGDFVIKRADNLFAYQLAVVVDDLEQGVTHVLRGKDLLDSTERQLYLARKIQPNSQEIRYFHAPLMCDESGARLSKRDGSLSVQEYISNGYTPEKMIGELASGLGLLEAPGALSVNELLATITEQALNSCIL